MADLFNKDEIRKLIEKELKGQKRKIQSEIKKAIVSSDVLYIDTETTGTRDEDLPVSVGTYSQASGRSNKFLKFNTEEETIEKLAQAMNIHGTGRQLIDSSKELRKSFGINDSNYYTRNKNKGDHYLDELKKAIKEKMKDTKWVAENFIDANELYSMLTQAASSGKKISGYNTNFDAKMLEKYFKANNFSKTKMDQIKKIIARFEDVLSSRVNSSLSKSKSNGNIQFLKGRSLQDIADLVLGAKSSQAHDSGADAETTALIDSQVTQDILKVLDDVVDEIAQRNNISKTEEKQGVIYYTKEYVELFNFVKNELSSILHNKQKQKSTTKKEKDSPTNSNTQRAQVKRVVSKEKKRVNSFYKRLSPTAKDALSGKHLIDRMKKLGIDITSLSSPKFGEYDENYTAKDSMAYYLEEIISEIEKTGKYGVVLNTNSNGNKLFLGVYNKEEQKDPNNLDYDKVSQIEIGLVDKDGLIEIGNKQVANLLSPIVSFSDMPDGSKKANKVLSSVQEGQLRAILPMIRKMNEDGGSQSELKRRLDNGDYEGVTSLLKHVTSEALISAPAGINNNILKELNFPGGKKNPEQMAKILSSQTIKEMAKSLYQNKTFREKVDKIYKDLAEEESKKLGYTKKAKEIDPYNLNQDEILAINVAFAFLNNGIVGPGSQEIQNMEDGFLKRILSNQEIFDMIANNLMPFIDAGMGPELNGVKEEAFLAGQSAFSGMHELGFGGQFVDPSSRAQEQSGNTLPKLGGNSQYSRPSMFTSKRGRDLGVDYTGKFWEEYAGAFTTDEKLYEALKKANADAELIASVLEGGIIFPEDMRDELFSYIEDSKTLKGKQANEAAELLADAHMVSRADLLTLRPGEKINIGKESDSVLKLAKNFKLEANDILQAIEKTDTGYRFIISRAKEAQKGTKILTGLGGRKTATFLPNEIYNEVISNLGLNSANFLTEQGSMNSKNLLETFRGRIAYIIQDAKDMGVSLDEIEKAMKNMPVIGKAIQRIGNSFELTAFYDRDTKEYKYTDDKGKTKILFDGKTEEEKREQVKKAFLESYNGGIETAISYLGKNLLGEEEYERSKPYIATNIGVAREFPYFDPTGGGNIDYREQKGGVRVARRERDALDQRFRIYGQRIKDKDSFQVYQESETKLYESFGKQGQKYRKDLEKINQAYLREASIKEGNTIELRWGGGSHDNIIDLSEIIGKLTYGKDGKLGVDSKEYKQSFGGRILSLAKRLGMKDPSVVLNLESLLGQGNFELTDNEMKKIVLANVMPTLMSDKSIMPSVTDNIGSAIIGAITKAIETGELFDLSQIGNLIIDKYGEIITNSHGEIIEGATSSYLPNATYAKAVGINNQFIKDQNKDSAYNTSYVSSDYFRKLLRYESGEKKQDKSDLAKNIQSLLWLYKAGEDKYIDKEFLKGIQGADDIDNLQKKTFKTLRKLEDQIIKGITQQIKQGKKISFDTHRYPSTSGLDIHGGFVGINDSMDYGSIGISRGQSILMNADYDGDKIWGRVGLLGNNFESEEEFKKAYEASIQIAEQEAKVAKHMQEWEEIKSKEKQMDSQEEVEKEQDKFASEILSRDRLEYSSIISKFNKQYVGSFSNLSTNLRRSKTFTGYGVLTPDATKEERIASAFSLLINAFTESLEQDAISAKKVAQRLINTQGTAGINELTNLENLIKNGKIEEAIQKSFDLGIIKTDENGYIDTRQFEIARTVVDLTDEETAKELGLDKGVTKETLLKAFRNLADYAEQKGFRLIDMLYNNESALSGQSNLDTKSRRRNKVNKNRIKTPVREPFRSSRRNPQFVSSRVKQQNQPVFNGNLLYEVLPVKESSDFSTSHNRLFNTEGDNWEVGETSVTGLLKNPKEQLTFQDKQKMEASSAMGTYSHKVAEILNKNNVSTIDQLSDDQKKEIIKAQEKLKAALGTLTQETLNSLNERAELALKVAKEQGIINDETETEVTLGGRLQDVGLLGGQADLITYTDNEAIIGDWKFSNDSSNQTNAKRLVQASAYMAMNKAKLEKDYQDLSKKGNLSQEEQQKLEDIKKKLEIINKNRIVTIVRSYEKNGQIFNEILKAEALDYDQVFDILRKAKINNYVDFTDVDMSKANISTYDSLGNLVEERNGDSSKVRAGELYTSKRDETVLINKYLQKYKELVTATTELIKLEKQLESIKKDGSKSTEQEVEAKEKAVEEAKKYVDTLKESLDLIGEYQENSGVLGNMVLTNDGKNLIDQRIKEINAKAEKDRAKNEYSQVRSDANNTNIHDNTSGKLMQEYLKNYKAQQQIERDIARTEIRLNNSSDIKKRNYQDLLKIQKERLSNLRAEAPIYDEQNKTINGVALSAEEIVKFTQAINILNESQSQKLAEINTQQREHKNLIQEIGEGFKASFRNLTDYTLAYKVIGAIQNSIRQLIQSTKELDSAMVDLQIASGNTRKEIYSMMLDFNGLANEVGKSTQEVAVAANDWLRAGYEGQEASELTQASMYLSTLGMIESSEATSYLISVLKGWKLEASDVLEVVDKLTVIICGVCLVISIGHKLNCR